MNIEDESAAIKSIFLKYDKNLIRLLLAEIGKLMFGMNAEQQKEVIEEISKAFQNSQDNIKAYNIKMHEIALAGLFDDNYASLERYGDNHGPTNWDEFNADIVKLLGIKS